jgi:hypothetical protein
MDKNTIILLLGSAFLFALVLAHSKNSRTRKFGRRLENEAGDLFFDEIL